MLNISKLSKKLVFKIPFQIVGITIIVLTAMCIFMGIQISNAVTDKVKMEINEVAAENANISQSYYNQIISGMSTLSSDVSYSIEMGLSYRVSNLVVSCVEFMCAEENGNFYKMNLAFKPASYDTITDRTLNTSKGLMYTLSISGKGVDKIICNDFNEYCNESYYSIVKETMETYLSDPYQTKTQEGETIWVFDISVPILTTEGEFTGVLNATVCADTLQSLAINLGEYDTSIAYTLTENGFYNFNSSDNSVVGTPFTQDSGKLTEIASLLENNETTVNTEKNADGKKVYAYYVPYTITNTDTQMISVFTVTESEAIASVTSTMVILIIFSIVAIILLCVLCVLVLRNSLRPLSKLVTLATDMGNGNFKSNIVINSQDEIGDLARTIDNTISVLSGYIDEISDVLGNISKGNLDLVVERDYIGDFSHIKTSMLDIIDSLNQTLTQTKNTADQVLVGAEQLASGSQALSQGATEQAGSIEGLSITIADIAKNVNNNAEDSQKAYNMFQNAEKKLGISNDQMKLMIDAMNTINQSSGQIGKIMKTIDDIAFQTNILALNASIEAARAGKAGKSFSVVAEEVRNLASKCTTAANSTTSLIEQSVNSIKQGMGIAAKTEQYLQEVVVEAKGITGIITNVAEASKSQANAINEITQGIDKISSVITTNSATAEESAASSEELSSQANLLSDLVGQFVLKQDSHRVSKKAKKAKRPAVTYRDELETSAEEGNEQLDKYTVDLEYKEIDDDYIQETDDEDDIDINTEDSDDLNY